MNDRAYFDALLAELTQARLAHPYLADAIDLECALLEAGRRLRVIVDVPALTLDAAQGRLRAGQALLQREDFTLDCDQAATFQQTVCAIVAAHRPELAEELDRLCQAVPSPCNGQRIPDQDASSGLPAYIQRQTLRPFLIANAQALLPLLAQVSCTTWRCPICQGRPDMAALARPDGQRLLLCCACDTQWPCQRIGCPFCGNEDPNTWAYYPSDDKVYRLYVCDACQGYLKTVDQRQQAEPLLLATERILTTSMDAAATDAGYRAYP